jgi:vitamin B12 transporter
MFTHRFPVLRARSQALGLSARLSLFTLHVLFTFFALTISAGVMAQPQSLLPVVVTGTREPTPLDRVVGDVVVIDAARIRASGADSIEDLLRREGGIQLSRNGGPGQSAAILLRGLGASSTLVLVDGVRVGSATLGQFDFAAFGLAQVERIEILRGPGSSLYGPDAVGGVVQIITRRGAAAPHFSARAELGELHSATTDVSLGGVSGAFDYAATLARESSRGISAIKPGDAFGSFNPDRDGYVRNSLQLHGGYALAPEHRIGFAFVESRLNAQYDSAEFAPPTFASDPSPDFRSRLATRLTSLDYRGAITRDWTTTLQLSDQVDDLLSGGHELSRFRTGRRQSTWQNAWRPGEGQQWLLALERLEEKVDATPFPTALRRDNDAVVLGYTGAFGALKVQVDARRDRNSVYGDVDTGKLGAAFELLPQLTLRAVYGTAFRAPTFNDLFFPGFGVATIGPERSRSVEVGLQWKTDTASAGVTVYRNKVRDLIAFEPDLALCPADPAYVFGCARNVDRATLRGATLTAAHRLGPFALRASVDFLDARNEATGARLPRRAAHQESLAADWYRGDWSAGAALLRVGARPDGGAQLPAYTIVDLQARYRIGAHWQLEARLLNAFDRRYEPVRDYQALGRQGWIGVRYDGAGL